MNTKRSGLWLASLLAAGLGANAPDPATPPPEKPKSDQGFWTLEEAEAGDPDFDVQGEYVGMIAGDARRAIGVQVIALGDGRFHAVFLPGGLPGAGWDGTNKAQCDGLRKGDRIVLTPASGSRTYMKVDRRKGNTFSATEAFPAPGQTDYTGTIAAGTLAAANAAGERVEAKKAVRRSPTLGAKPPEGAVVLLPYEPGRKPSLEGWSFAKGVPWEALAEGGMAIAGVVGNNASIRKPFGGDAWTLHLEFRTIFKPRAMGQGRSNSGIYISGLPEIQVLDSFGLAGLKNECGAFYGRAAPRVNACLPPLTWQTIDVTLAAAGGAAPAAPARATVSHNGVVVLEEAEVKGGGGGLMLQHHTENGLAFRNIWVAPIRPPGGGRR
jgi:hypothetical protein